jgi:hypothetical protein
MFRASNSNHESKHEAELDNIAILKELKLFFMNNKHQALESQDCSRYNSVLEPHNVLLVYVEDEKIHKLFVNDEPLEPKDAINILDKMIEFLQSNAPRIIGSFHSNSSASFDNLHVQSHAGGDSITVIGDVTAGGSLYVGGYHKHKHYDRPILDEAALSSKQVCLMELQKKLVEHCQDEHWYLKRLFDDTKTPIENSYISLSIITADERQKKQKQLEEVDNTKSDHIFRTIDERTPSSEDLFVHKEPIALSDLFKAEPGEYGSPKRLIVFGRAGIGKSILCQYLAVRWYQEVLENSAKPLMLNPSEEIKEKAEKVPLPWLQNFKLVFWIRLREIPALLQVSKKNSSLKNIINHCCYTGKANQDILKAAIKAYQQESLFILDGYDEIEEILDKDSPIHQPALLAVWNTLKEQTNVILTSRPRNLDLWPRDKAVRKLEVMGFSNEQVEDYVQNFMAESSNKGLSAPDLLTYLKSRASIWGIVHIPINLEMLCWLYRERKISNQANSLSMLYEKIIEGVVLEMPKKHKVLNRWLEVPILGREGIQRYALKEIGLQFLAHLAYQGMLKNELLLSSKTIELSAKAVLRAHKISYEKSLSEKLLETSHQLGFLFSTSQGGKSIADQSHYFIHLSFQEHFGARFIASRLSTNADEKENREHALIQEIQQNKHHPRYQLMWWLTAGLLAHYGTEKDDYEALKAFASHVFLGFLSQDYMSEVDFRLAAHCLDECIGVNNAILPKLLNNSEHEDLKEKMRKYFSCFIFYPKSNLREHNLEILERCSNFLSIQSFIDATFFKRLIAFVQNKSLKDLLQNKSLKDDKDRVWETFLKISEHSTQSAVELIALAQDKSGDADGRIQAWEALLKMPKHANQAAVELIALAQDESILVFKRREVLARLLKTPEHAKQAVATMLIALVRDKNVDADGRREALEILLKISEHSTQSAVELIALAQDKSVDADGRMQAWATLLKMPEYENQAAAELVALVEDKCIGTYRRMQAWAALLKMPEHASQAAAELIALAQDKSVLASERREVWACLLKTPEHAKQAIATMLIALVRDKSVDVDERKEALEILLKISEHSTQAAAELIALAQDESVLASKRREVLARLLKTPEHAKQAVATMLIALAQDKSVDADGRMQAWATLLKMPEYENQAAAELVALVEDKRQAWAFLLKRFEHANQEVTGLITWARDESVGASEIKKALEILLKIPEHASQAGAELIKFAQDKSIDASERIRVWKSLSKIPEHASRSAVELIALAQDKSVDAYIREQVWRVLLGMSEHVSRSAVELIALAQDKSLEAWERGRVWEVLLKIPENSSQIVASLIAWAQDKSVIAYERRRSWKTLLNMSEYANQAVTELITWAQDKNVEASERRKALEILLKIPEHASQAGGELIEFAQDKNVEASERRKALEILLKIPEHASQAGGELIEFAQDKNVEASERRKALEILLKIPEHASQAGGELIEFAQDKSVEASERRKALKILLKIPKYANQAVVELFTWMQDKSVKASEREKALAILLEIPEHVNQVVATLITLIRDNSIEDPEGMIVVLQFSSSAKQVGGAFLEALGPEVLNRIENSKKNKISESDENPSVVVHLDQGHSLEQKGSSMLPQFNHFVAKPLPKKKAIKHPKFPSPPSKNNYTCNVS